MGLDVEVTEKDSQVCFMPEVRDTIFQKTLL